MTVLDPARHTGPTDTRGGAPGAAADAPDGERLPSAAEKLLMYRSMVVARAFNEQATAFSRQGRLAVYPSSRGQEASQAGSALAVRAEDWVFPTYRDSAALVTRGVDPVEVLALFRGDQHCGYDPAAVRAAPQCTPLATQCPHAVGLADAARMHGDPVVALVYLGDGATSEGDFHEALNYAAVRRAPAVFFVQNNQYAISVPLAKQTAAGALADKAAGYGAAGVRVDGNDVLAVYGAVRRAAERARAGHGPTLVEALTYRLDPHTDADDDTRYRTPEEVRDWAERDPVDRFRRRLLDDGTLAGADVEEAAEYAERFTAALRERISARPARDPREIFRHVYSRVPAHLREQAALLEGELTAAEGRS